jgi:uncharacterized protein YcnI
MTRWLRNGLLALALASAGAGAASAHVKVYPQSDTTQIPACSYGKFVVRVPTEKPIPTVRLVLTIPAGVTVSAAQSKPGWNVAFATSKGRIVSIDWSGGQIPPHEFDEFAFLAKAPKTAGRVDWNAQQYYADGSVVKWEGPAGADTPHSQTTIAPAACKQD